MLLAEFNVNICHMWQNMKIFTYKSSYTSVRFGQKKWAKIMNKELMKEGMQVTSKHKKKFPMLLT